MHNLDIFFNAESHKYTDSAGNKYISVTTLLGKYGHKFDTYKMAKACEAAGKRGNPKYRGQSAEDLMSKWARDTQHAINIGNEKHDYLETSVKTANNYYSIFDRHTPTGRLYTISDILSNPGYGKVDLDYFIKLGVKDRYPAIYNLIEFCAKEGYKMYPEICTYNPNFLISGLIDLLLVKDDSFAIIDWKTNRDSLRFESGYFEKDRFGNVTNTFIRTEQQFKFPLQMYPYSKGNIYTFQLSLYAYLTEFFGLKHKISLLCHIRHADATGVEKVDIHTIDYRKDDINSLVKHFTSNMDVKAQYKMFNL